MSEKERIEKFLDEYKDTDGTSLCDCACTDVLADKLIDAGIRDAREVVKEFVETLTTTSSDGYIGIGRILGLFEKMYGRGNN